MFLRQSTSQVIRFGPFLDSTDGVTPETGLTIAQADMQLSKDGAAFAQKNASGNATHDTDGWYSTTLNTTDTATTGELKIQINVSGALPVWEKWFVLTQSAYDALQTGTFNNLGGTAQTADHTAAIADIPTVSEFNARTLLAANYFDFTSDAVQVGTNNDKAGYSISGTLNTLDDLENLAQTDVVTSGAIQTAVGVVVNVGIVENLNTIDDGAIKATTIAANALDGKGDWNIGKTGYSLTQTFPTNFADMAITVTAGKLTIGTNDDKTGYSISGTKQTLDALNDITASSVLTAGDIDGFTLEETQKLILSASVGILAGAATNSITIQAADGSKTRITATVDGSGNRTLVVKDASG